MAFLIRYNVTCLVEVVIRIQPGLECLILYFPYSYQNLARHYYLFNFKRDKFNIIKVHNSQLFICLVYESSVNVCEDLNGALLIFLNQAAVKTNRYARPQTASDPNERKVSLSERDPPENMMTESRKIREVYCVHDLRFAAHTLAIVQTAEENGQKRTSEIHADM